MRRTCAGMAQLSNPNADAALRKHLIALRTELRMLFTDTLLGESPEWGEYAYRECSKGVDPLVARRSGAGAPLRAPRRARAGRARGRAPDRLA
jgi:hypothetical protein